MKKVALSLLLISLAACSPKQFESLNRPKSAITEAVTTVPLAFPATTPSPSGSDAATLPPETPSGAAPQPLQPVTVAPVTTPSLLPVGNSRCEQILQCAIANTELNSRRLYYQQLLVNVASAGQGDNTPGCASLIATVAQQVPICQ